LDAEKQYIEEILKINQIIEDEFPMKLFPINIEQIEKRIELDLEGKIKIIEEKVP